MRVPLALIIGTLLTAAPALSQSPRPNIVLVLADDLGYGDLACFGSKDVKTPHLDRLAADGLRFTSCYAGHANCSPSRTALMTGRTPTRVGIRNWIPQDSPVHVPRSEITIATLLKRAGYATCHAGKWHMNGQFNESTQPQPVDHGFEHWFSTQNNALPNHKNPVNFVRNGEPVGKLEGYSAPLVAAEAIRWLSEVRDKTKPFFLYVCFHEPHEPIASDAQFAKLYPSEDPSYTAHHGNITQMDDAFGRLMRSLDDQSLRDNTLVLFTSDNGPAITAQHPHGSAGPLRDKKGSLYEGGIRVPGILAGRDVRSRAARPTSRSAASISCPPCARSPASSRPRTACWTARAGSPCSPARASIAGRRSTGISTKPPVRPKSPCARAIGRSWPRSTGTRSREATTSPIRKSATSRKPPWGSSRSTTCGTTSARPPIWLSASRRSWPSSKRC